MVTAVETEATGADAALAPLAMAPAAVLVVAEELPAVTMRSTPTPPAATTVNASAKTHTPAVRGATTGALTGVPSEVPSEMLIGALSVEVPTVVVGATRTPGATVLEETATSATTTVATAGTEAIGTGAAVREALATIAGGVPDGIM